MRYLSISAQLLSLFFFLLFTACSNGAPEADMEDAQEEMAEMTSENESDDSIEQLADYNWLKGYLPAKVGDENATATTAELTNMMGFKISRAQATYDESTTISISDVSLAGADLGKLGAWVATDIAHVDEESFERTTMTNDTYRTLEKYNADTETATVSVLVAERYLITAVSDRTHRVDDLKAAIQSMDLTMLAGIQ